MKKQKKLIALVVVLSVFIVGIGAYALKSNSDNHKQAERYRTELSKEKEKNSQSSSTTKISSSSEKSSSSSTTISTEQPIESVPQSTSEEAIPETTQSKRLDGLVADSNYILSSDISNESIVIFVSDDFVALDDNTKSEIITSVLSPGNIVPVYIKTGNALSQTQIGMSDPLSPLKIIWKGSEPQKANQTTNQSPNNQNTDNGQSEYTKQKNDDLKKQLDKNDKKINEGLEKMNREESEAKEE
ncbi:hypothetical protein BG262_02945 [Floricoccus penangensis]|uniref:Uncharacterized protein n=1 Tax=Floricoccus penangensis TaxID=1859475 RepID=A0A9Q5JGX3_9LACT|nr:hypothetical protein [Floricoccus penangensis]OFI46771.1 hypothetical protein BG262_02945 [Floricoccus penangensis]